MTHGDFDFSTRPSTGRVDSLAGFSALSFSPVNDSVDNAANSKFSFSPQQNPVDFDPASFDQAVEQTTIHPSVLSGSNGSFDAPGQAPDGFFNQQSLFTSLPNARKFHGQITPPDDMSPKSADSKLGFNPAECDEVQVKVEDSTETTASNKRKRSTRANAGSSIRKRGRKSAVVVDDESQEPEDKAKRDQFLERNRVAAHKCRQKKKEWMVQLDNDCRTLSAKNKYLAAEVNMLSNTLYELKNLVFQHADCDYQPINEFISAEAERVRVRAQTAADPAAPAPAHEPYAHPNTTFSSQGPGVFPGQRSVDVEGSVDEGSPGSSDLQSRRSRSTASDGMMNESWADMLQQSY